MNEISFFDEFKSQVATFVDPTKAIVVVDAASNAVAAGALRTIKDFQKQIDARRVATVKPLNDRVSAVNDYAKQISQPLIEAEKMLKGKMVDWAEAERRRADDERRKLEEQRREQERRDAAEREAALQKQREEEEAMKMFGVDESEAKAKAEAQAAADQIEADRRAAEADLERRQRLSNISASQPKNTREVVRWQVEKPEELPKDYWMVNEAALGAAIRSGAQVPGVRVWKSIIIVAR